MSPRAKGIKVIFKRTSPMEASLYDAKGIAVAYFAEDGETIYTWDGEAIAYEFQGKVYGWNGKHLGWYQGDILYDQDGYQVGYHEQQCPVVKTVPSVKSVKSVRSVKSVKEVASAKPVCTSTASDEPLIRFLEKGR